MKKLEQARTTLTEIEAKIAELTAKRRGRLLAGDAANLIGRLDDEIGALQRAARTEVDRIALLEIEARRAEAEAIARRRAETITRV